MYGAGDDIGAGMPSLLAGGALTLHYQPVATCDRSVVGLEALMRWHHRDRGRMSPEAFIPIFERSGLIVPVARWALDHACTEAASWPVPLQVAVNISAIQFDQDDLPDLVGGVLQRTGLAPARLELEVTEAALTNNAADVSRTMQRLRNLGVEIALAGFGTGRSGPSYLKDFPFSRIKVTCALVSQIETSAPARSIVRMVIALGHALGVHVAADDVETEGQLSFLAGEGCDRVQGFLIGHPGPIDLHAALTGTRAPKQHVRAARPAWSAPSVVTAV
jgi:EAL domain-containing protein (putative c-di-GMP-specific phosphodiesterase class I)